MKRILLLTLSAATITFSAEAQNLKVSQYTEAPLFYNPAAAGNFEGKVRVSALLSSQHTDSAKLNHILVSADYSIKKDNNSWGFGLTFHKSYHPEFLMSSSHISATIARHIFVDEDNHHMLSAGLQVAYASTITNTEKYSYSDEITSGGFKVIGAPTNTSASYADVNIGGMYTYKNDAVTIQAGLAAYHITAPTYTLNDKKIHQPRRLDLTVDTRIQLNYNNELHLSAMMWQSGFRSSYKDPPTAEYIYGAMMESFVGETTAVHYGLSTRSGNTITPVGGLSFNNNKLRFKASYELPLNKGVYQVTRGELSALVTL